MIGPNRRFVARVLIRLFRRWKMLRDEGDGSLGRMHDLVVQFRLPVETAPACASFFELVEAQLQRSLICECCCSRRFSSDEHALVGVIEAAPSLNDAIGSSEVPHGLPGAVRWSAMAVRRALGWPGSQTTRPATHRDTCPFDRSSEEKTRAV